MEPSLVIEPEPSLMELETSQRVTSLVEVEPSQVNVYQPYIGGEFIDLTDAPSNAISDVFDKNEYEEV